LPGLDSLREQLEAKVVRTADRVAREVEAELKQTAPVDTGLLRQLITAQVRKVANGARIDFESGASYDIYVAEFREDWDRMLRSLPGRIERAWRAIR